MAYYRFARAADDIADHPTASPAEKLRLLAHMRAGPKAARRARAILCAGAGTRLPRGDQLAHAHDLLDAFVQDCTQIAARIGTG
jgi:phytoene/squalene synthetase